MSKKTFKNIQSKSTYQLNVGKQCNKISGKPFKSGEKINTIKGVIDHPVVGVPAYIFKEDDSYVSCYQCEICEV